MPPNDVLNLQQQWEYQSQSSGIRNINCGQLRRIGKTHTLIQMIREYDRNHPQRNEHIVVVVPNEGLGELYQRLIRERCLDRIVVVSDMERQLRGTPSVIFADEVPNIEQIIVRSNLWEFIAGFYNDIHQQRISVTREQSPLYDLSQVQQLPFPQPQSRRYDLIDTTELYVKPPKPLKYIKVDVVVNKSLVDKNNKMKFITKYENKKIISKKRTKKRRKTK